MKKIFSTILFILCLPPLAWGQYSINYRKGYAAYELGDQEEALNYFEEDLADNPRSGATLAMCALLYDSMGDHNKSLHLAEKAILCLDKKDKSNIAMCQCLCGVSHAALGDTAQALKYLDMAIRTDKSYTYPIRRKVLIFSSQGEEGKALKECKSLIEKEPSEPANFYLYALTLNMAGRTDEAIRQATRAIRLAPREPFYYGSRAGFYCKNEDYANAADDIVQCLTLGGNRSDFSGADVSISNCPAIVPKLKGVISRDPSNVATSYYLATLQENAGMPLDAARTLKDSYEAVPNPNTAYCLATDLYEAGLFDLASGWAGLCISTDTMHYASPFLLMSDISYENGYTDFALDYIDIYIKTTHNAWGYYKRGWIYDHANRLDDALSDYTTAININPDHAYFYLVRGMIYRKLYQTAKAQADFRKVVELEENEDFPECLHFAYHYLGDDVKAAEAMENTLIINPDKGDYYDAACLYSVMGQRNTALTYLEKSLQMGFRRFAHIERDDDLDNIRKSARFKSLIERYKDIYAKEAADAAQEFAVKYDIASEEPASGFPAFDQEGSRWAIASQDYGGGGINIDDLPANGQTGGEATVLDNAIVEVPAIYPGGETALLEFVNRNVVYPAIAIEQELQGTVILRFKVDVDGSVSDIIMEKSLSEECDKAAAHVVHKLKRFIPAKQKGQAVPVWFRLPVRFRIS